MTTDQTRPVTDVFRLGATAGSMVEAYERWLVPTIFAPWGKRLVDLAVPRRGERVLDVACGTGVVARLVAPHVGDEGTIVGIDLLADMLDVARTVSTEDHPPIEWHTADAVDLPLPDGDSDLVCCQQGLQFFSDRAAALRETRRVLAPGGRLALTVWRPLEYLTGYLRLAESVTRHAGPEIGTMMRVFAPSWEAGDLRNLVTEAGFRDVRVRIDVGSLRFPSSAEFLRQIASATPMRGHVEALGADTYQAIERDLDEALRGYTDDEGLIFPAEAYAVTARR